MNHMQSLIPADPDGADMEKLPPILPAVKKVFSFEEDNPKYLFMINNIVNFKSSST